MILKLVAADEGLDAHDFIQKAETHFFDVSDRASNLDSIVISWDGGKDGVRRG